VIPKIIHLSWKDNNILSSNHVFPKNTIQKLISLSPNWKINLNTDKDIEDFLISKLDKSDYSLIKDSHIVEKSDIWRLIKLYEEGGIYTDIDRLCNTALDDIITEDTKCILPTCLDNDFSQDFMCSAPYNPIFMETFKLNMERRKSGHKNTYFLGPQTYMHGVTKALFGEIIDVNPTIEVFTEIRKALKTLPFISTYREEPPYNTIIYQPKNTQVNFDHEEQKRNFYASCKLKHWTGDW
jgi:mannosyltransferase OCH1-like enzyme